MRPGLPSHAALCVVASLIMAGCATTSPPLASDRPTGPQGSNVAVTSSATPSPSAAPSAPASTSPTDTPSSAASAVPTIVVTPKPLIGACQASQLVAHVTRWEGAAGHRIAYVRMRNAGPPCHLAAMARPELVGSRGVVLIDGHATPSAALTLAS